MDFQKKRKNKTVDRSGQIINQTSNDHDGFVKGFVFFVFVLENQWLYTYFCNLHFGIFVFFWENQWLYDHFCPSSVVSSAVKARQRSRLVSGQGGTGGHGSSAVNGAQAVKAQQSEAVYQVYYSPVSLPSVLFTS